jgi:branched-subunit amino acid transport protein
MRTLWATVLLASFGCYGLKLAGVSLPQSVLNHPRVQQTAGLLPVAMLTALVVTDLFGANGRYSADWYAMAGVGAGAVALRLRQSLVVVFLVAVAATAALRALT